MLYNIDKGELLFTASERSIMYGVSYCAAIRGIEGCMIQVEADISDGLPGFSLVGYLASEVKDITIAKMIQIRARKVAEICRFLPNIRGIPRFKVLISPHRASF